jgi:hypothetical protein
VIVLIFALSCAGIGALVLGSAVYWRLRALRVPGVIVGVRGRGVYRVVYRYTLPSGESHEAASTQGSSSVAGLTTGATVPLRVLAGRPDQVEEARSHVWTWIGVLCLAGSAWAFHLAVTAWPVGPMTWVIAGVAAVYIGVKIFRRRRVGTTKPIPSVASSVMQRIEDVAALPSARSEQVRSDASRRRWAPLLLLIGLSLFGAAIFLSRSVLQLESSGLRAAGIVESLQTSPYATAGSAYYPLVRFSTENGAMIRFRDNSGSNPPAYHRGEKVTVKYRAARPDDAMIDRGAWNWLPPLLTLAIGAFLSAFGATQLAARWGARLSA